MSSGDPISLVGVVDMSTKIVSNPIICAITSTALEVVSFATGGENTLSFGLERC